MLLKCPTGIEGLDEITEGGLPQGRTTLVCGSAGCGKTLMAMEFLVRGAVQFDEPGVFVAFEETIKEITENVASLGFDLDELVAQKKIRLDYVRVERSEIEETGEYDLEGLFIRLDYAIRTIGAKRVVLDTIESLFAGLSNTAILRAELRRLFAWIKERGVTAIITGERGDGSLTRQGLEEYVSDCVILLDQRIINQVATRRLRVVKYRGSTHGTNEYPFLIDNDGISVLPITSLTFDHPISRERVSSGVPRLDAMLGGKGFFRGSSILVSGTAGTGKSSLATHFVDAACRRGETCLYLAFEESQGQMVRNMRSIGIDLEPWMEQGLLRFSASRPTSFGLEMHLAVIHKQIRTLKPQIVVIDPLSSFLNVAGTEEVSNMLTRLIDFLKMQQITCFCTNLLASSAAMEAGSTNVSSVMDAWLLLREIETGGERNRGLYILKSRGMAHSNQVREFVLTDHGVELLDVYLGPEGALTGSARVAREAQVQEERTLQREALERKRLIAEQRRKALEAQMTLLQVQIEEADDAFRAELEAAELRVQEQEQRRTDMARSRKADPLEAEMPTQPDLPDEMRGKN